MSLGSERTVSSVCQCSVGLCSSGDVVPHSANVRFCRTLFCGMFYRVYMFYSLCCTGVSVLYTEVLFPCVLCSAGARFCMVFFCSVYVLLGLGTLHKGSVVSCLGIVL